MKSDWKLLENEVDEGQMMQIAETCDDKTSNGTDNEC